jgi:glycosyltransferase involved in cell wall biosynthesis
MGKKIDLVLGVPTYNSAKFLPQLFRSISDLSTLPKQILFVDNCSQDSTVSMIEEFSRSHPQFNVRVSVNESNLGIAGNWNRILDLCDSATWIQLMDSDDYVCSPDYYEIIAERLQRCSEAPSLIVTSMTSNLWALNVLPAIYRFLRVEKLPKSLPIQGLIATKSGLIFPLEKLKKTKYYNPNFDGADILITKKFMDNAIFVGDAQTFYLIHEGANTKQLALNHSPYLAEIAKYDTLDRWIFGVDFFVRKKLFSWLRN